MIFQTSVMSISFVNNFYFNVTAAYANYGFNNWPNIHTKLAFDKKSKKSFKSDLEMLGTAGKIICWIKEQTID